MRGESYSSAFDAAAGVYFRGYRVVNKIVDAKLASDKLKETHQEIYSEYTEAKTRKETLEAELASLETQKATIQNDLATVLLTLTAEEREVQLESLREEAKEKTLEVQREDC